MDVDLTLLDRILIAVYFAIWTVFALLGVRRLWVLRLYRRAKRTIVPEPAPPAVLPRVTVQLPVYNERYVIRRLIRAAAALEYPRELLEIQVLDDSTDDTAEAARDEVARLAAQGLDVKHLRRGERHGYKAGALAWGLGRAKGELVLILDADFVPDPALLSRIVPRFSDPRVGMVQVRWEHLNADWSILARVQGISLDGHFVVEHEARAKNGLFFNFNGTAGMWRRACIEDAGGWQHDTLTEDLDLSYRAQLAGWRFVYLQHVTCAAELPVDMRAFKSQQYRWVKGSMQVARKILPRIWSSGLPLRRKLESSIHLAHNATYVLVLVLSLCAYPAVLTRYAADLGTLLAVEVPLFLLATGSVIRFYAVATTEGGRSLARQWRYFPAVMAVAIGLSVNNTRAVLAGLFGGQSPFHRTPKYDIRSRADTPRGKRYRGMRSGTAWAELALGVYFAWILAFVLGHGLLGAAPFVALFLSGYLWVGWQSLESWPRRPAP